ncbi:MAG: DNA methyltransferase [Acidobacteriota bacterium]
MTDIWEDTAPARHSQFKARWGINELKPIIPSRCIQLTTNPGDIVLDPFGGGGSTFEAAELLGRSWLGSEIVDCSLTAERFSRNVTGAKLLLPRNLSHVFKNPNLRLALNRQCQKSSKNNHSTEPQISFPALVSMNSSQKSARS